MKTNKKNPGRGRPTAYKPEYVQEVFKLAKLGATDADIADFFGVTEATLANWNHKFPGFIESKKAGKEVFDTEKVEKALRDRALGYVGKETKVLMVDGKVETVEVDKVYPPETAAGIFWLKNRNPKKWRDKIEQTVDVTTKGESLNDGPSAEAVERARLAIQANLDKGE